MPTIEERLDSLESRFGKNDELVRGLRENYIVMVEMEARQSRLLREHSEIMAQHDLSLARSRENAERMEAQFRRSQALHEGRMAEIDRRIADLVSGFGEFMRRQPPGA